MERQIVFRGKRIKDGKWIYGNLADYSMNVLNTTVERKIIFGNIVSFATDNFGFVVDDCAVDPETIGQFTGLLDRNGKEIYEGDIVRYYDDIEDELVSSHVIYHKESCSFCTAPTKLCGDYIGICAHWQFEVIGNIFDNPSLISDKL